MSTTSPAAMSFLEDLHGLLARPSTLNYQECACALISTVFFVAMSLDDKSKTVFLEQADNVWLTMMARHSAVGGAK